MEEEHIHFERVEQYNDWAHVDTLHPLISTFHVSHFANPVTGW